MKSCKIFLDYHLEFIINNTLISGLGTVHVGEQTANEIISEVDWDNLISFYYNNLNIEWCS